MGAESCCFSEGGDCGVAGDKRGNVDGWWGKLLDSPVL